MKVTNLRSRERVWYNTTQILHTKQSIYFYTM